MPRNVSRRNCSAFQIPLMMCRFGEIELDLCDIRADNCRNMHNPRFRCCLDCEEKRKYEQEVNRINSLIYSCIDKDAPDAKKYTCIECGREFFAADRRKRIFCSLKCQQTNVTKKKRSKKDRDRGLELNGEYKRQVENILKSDSGATEIMDCIQCSALLGIGLKYFRNKVASSSLVPGFDYFRMPGGARIFISDSAFIRFCSMHGWLNRIDGFVESRKNKGDKNDKV